MPLSARQFAAIVTDPRWQQVVAALPAAKEGFPFTSFLRML
jgi:hypothetical protein